MGDIFKERYIKFYANKDNRLTVNAVPGHFATSQAHVNFYVDVTRMKVRVNEAKNAALALATKLRHHITEVDTIVCLDETDMLGGFLAYELEKSNEFFTSNMHETIYVVHPETATGGNQLTFRDNNKLAIEGKKVLVLNASISTGLTSTRAMNCIEYYGGTVVGVVSLFSLISEVKGFPIYALVTKNDIPQYELYNPNECPYCAKKIPIEALVSGLGYTLL